MSIKKKNKADRRPFFKAVFGYAAGYAGTRLTSKERRQQLEPNGFSLKEINY